MNRAISFSISLIGHVTCVGLLMLSCKPAKDKPIIMKTCRVTLFAPGQIARSAPPTEPAPKRSDPRPTMKQPRPPARPKIVTRTVTRPKPLPRVEPTQEFTKISRLERDALPPVPRRSASDDTWTRNASVSTAGSSSYDAIIAGIIKSNWVRPSRAVVGEDPPSVSVAIQIALDGTITGRRVTSSSGIRLLDASALKAIERSNPLPVGLPSSMGCRVYDVTIVFRIADEA